MLLGRRRLPLHVSQRAAARLFIPMDGAVGDLVRVQQRQGCRPAHIHFLISAPGFRELVTALYFLGPYLETDVVFGASPELVANEKPSDPQAPAKGLPSVHFDFTLTSADSVDASGGRVGADPTKLVGASRLPPTDGIKQWGAPSSCGRTRRRVGRVGLGCGTRARRSFRPESGCSPRARGQRHRV